MGLMRNSACLVEASVASDIRLLYPTAKSNVSSVSISFLISIATILIKPKKRG